VKTRTLIRKATAVAVVAVAGALAGCGNSATPAASPSTIFPQSSPTGTLPALRAYLGDVQDVLDQMATTVGALPDAVSGISAKPDDTWQSSAAQLQSIGTQLGDEASALAALQPPTALQPVQDAVVQGVRAAQSGVQKLADTLQSGSSKASATRAQIQERADQLRSQIEGLSQQLENAIGALTGQ
jgi:uncharacterized phage infection (PIP) family protein YhgE